MGTDRDRQGSSGVEDMIRVAMEDTEVEIPETSVAM